ncbi:hypothetical protein DV736_g2780, partial [Chaetothyriales sp. CBS 134916]
MPNPQPVRSSMEVRSNDGSVNKLGETLLDAVTHSRALFSLLEDQTRTIESLRRENDKLRWEIEQWKNATPDVTAQLDRLFQQNAAKQAEIESLKADLRAAKREGDRASASLKDSLLPTLSDSSDAIDDAPCSLPDDHASAAVSLNSFPLSTKRASDAASVSSPAPKRRRNDADDGALGTLSDRTLNVTLAWHGLKDRDRSSHGAEAILAVTEDGQDHNRHEENQNSNPVTSENTRPGLHLRLNTLLSTTPPTHDPLSRINPAARPLDPRPTLQKTPSFNKITSDHASVLKPDRPSNLRFLHPARRREIATKDKYPLRRRPLDQLNLSHFKLNPEYTGYGVEEHAHGKKASKCLPGCRSPRCCGSAMRAIAMSFAPDNHIADDDLLLDFLGPRSEQRVATLTSLARENLLHEARIKRAANEYGKLHRNSRDRAASPTGFWGTGMHGSEEEQKICEEARRWERSEVKRRYHEAQNWQGKWVFADEV